MSNRRAKVYLVSYLLMYIARCVVGMATTYFNANFMLDTTNLYMIAVLSFLLVGF